MEAKSKVTVKSLSTKFSKFSEENKNLKEWVKYLEKKLEKSEEKKNKSIRGEMYSSRRTL